MKQFISVRELLKYFIFLALAVALQFQGPGYVRAAETSVSDGLRILMMAPEYKKDWGLIRDRNSVAGQYDMILEPESFTEALEQIRKFGKAGKEKRIKQLTFLGHGDVSGGVMDFGGTDVNASLMGTLQTKALAEADSTLVDSFADNAEVIFYQCYAGRDSEFVHAAASLFLAFSGGTVYASPEAVASPTTAGNKMMRLLRIIGVSQQEDIQHKSPSDVSYKEFNSFTLSKFEPRDTKPVEVSIEGPNFAVQNGPVTLKGLVPEAVNRQSDLKPFMKYYWYKEEGTRKKSLGTTEEISVNTTVTGLYHLNFQVRISNGLAAKAIGKNVHQLLVEEERTLGIELSSTTPEPGDKITATAKLTKGSLPQDAMWYWAGSGGIHPASTGGETVDVQVDQTGELKLSLKRMGAFGQIHDLATASTPITVVNSVLNLSAPSEVMETDMFSAALTLPETVKQKAEGGKVVATWTPRTVGPENTLTPNLQFVETPKDAVVGVNLNNERHVEKGIVVKPACFEGSTAGSWEVKTPPGKTLLMERTPSKIEQEINFNGPAVARASVDAKMEAWLGTLTASYGEINPPDSQRVDQELREKLKDEEGELSALTLGDFKGYMVSRKPVFSPGAWTGGGFRTCDVSAGGHGFAVKGWAMIEVRYGVFGSGWFDNRFKDFMLAQAAAAQGEAAGVISSLRLSPAGGFAKTPYSGPELVVTMPSEITAGASPPPPAPATPPPASPNPSASTPSPVPAPAGGVQNQPEGAISIVGTAKIEPLPDFSHPDQVVARGQWGAFEVLNIDMTLHGRHFTRYILQHPGDGGPTEVHYALKAKAHRLTAWVGIDQSMNLGDTIVTGAKVRVTATGDGRVLWESGPVQLSTAPLQVNVDLTGVQELVLAVDDGGDGTAFDWLVWADPEIK